MVAETPDPDQSLALELLEAVEARVTGNNDSEKSRHLSILCALSTEIILSCELPTESLRQVRNFYDGNSESLESIVTKFREAPILRDEKSNHAKVVEQLLMWLLASSFWREQSYSKFIKLVHEMRAFLEKQRPSRNVSLNAAVSREDKAWIASRAYLATLECQSVIAQIRLGERSFDTSWETAVQRGRDAVTEAVEAAALLNLEEANTAWLPPALNAAAEACSEPFERPNEESAMLLDGDGTAGPKVRTACDYGLDCVTRAQRLDSTYAKYCATEAKLWSLLGEQEKAIRSIFRALDLEDPRRVGSDFETRVMDYTSIRVRILMRESLSAAMQTAKGVSEAVKLQEEKFIQVVALLTSVVAIIATIGATAAKELKPIQSLGVVISLGVMTGWLMILTLGVSDATFSPGKTRGVRRHLTIVIYYALKYVVPLFILTGAGFVTYALAEHLLQK